MIWCRLTHLRYERNNGITWQDEVPPCFSFTNCHIFSMLTWFLISHTHPSDTVWLQQLNSMIRLIVFTRDTAVSPLNWACLCCSALTLLSVLVPHVLLGRFVYLNTTLSGIKVPTRTPWAALTCAQQVFGSPRTYRELKTPVHKDSPKAKLHWLWTF